MRRLDLSFFLGLICLILTRIALDIWDIIFRMRFLSDFKWSGAWIELHLTATDAPFNIVLSLHHDNIVLLVLPIRALLKLFVQRVHLSSASGTHIATSLLKNNNPTVALVQLLGVNNMADLRSKLRHLILISVSLDWVTPKHFRGLDDRAMLRYHVDLFRLP